MPSFSFVLPPLGELSEAAVLSADGSLLLFAV